jgi:hypothetical protein
VAVGNPDHQHMFQSHVLGHGRSSDFKAELKHAVLSLERHVIGQVFGTQWHLNVAYMMSRAREPHAF